MNHHSSRENFAFWTENTCNFRVAEAKTLRLRVGKPVAHRKRLTKYCDITVANTSEARRKPLDLAHRQPPTLTDQSRDYAITHARQQGV